MNKDLHWVDAVKAICMISVYILHCEAYYGTAGVSFGFLLHPFYVNAFFVVSGYLMFRKFMPIIHENNWYIQGLSTLFFRLILPTILFSTIIFYPKMIFHGITPTTSELACRVLGGTSFWFTSCLTIAQLMLLTMFLCRSRYILPYLIGAIVLSAAALVLHSRIESPFPWYYKSGCFACFFMALGGTFYKYEAICSKLLENRLFLVTGGGITFILLLADYHYQFSICTVMGCKANAAGISVSILSIAILIGICKQLPQLHILKYIGRHSIVFYFFSGVCPAAFATGFHKFAPWNGYMITLLCCLMSLVAVYVISLIINKWFPWLLDLRKLKETK